MTPAGDSVWSTLPRGVSGRYARRGGRGGNSRSTQPLETRRPRREPSRPEQARQESNLQPPVLETGALPIELRT